MAGSKVPMDIISEIRKFNLCDGSPINKKEEQKWKDKLLNEHIMSPVIKTYFKKHKIQPSALIDILFKSLFPDENKTDEQDWKQFNIFRDILTALPKQCIINLISKASDYEESLFDFVTTFDVEESRDSLRFNGTFQNDRFSVIRDTLQKVPVSYLCKMKNFMESPVGFEIMSDLRHSYY